MKSKTGKKDLADIVAFTANMTSTMIHILKLIYVSNLITFNKISTQIA